MPYFALHLEDGTFVGLTNQEPVALPGVSIKQLDTVPNLENYVWNSDIFDFIRTNSTCTKLEFMTRFTSEERSLARLSTDPIVQDFLSLMSLAEYIDLKDQNTISGINYLVSKGIITPERSAEILQ